MQNSPGKSDDLSRACSALTVQEVWRRAGLADPPKEGNRLVRSPFREDRSASFSIFAGGRGWRDHASGEHGGVWDFAATATGKSGRELADWLIEASGITRSTDLGRTRKAVRSALRSYPSRRAAEAAEKLRLAALAPRVRRRPLADWSAEVEARWSEGLIEAQAAAVCAERGWPLGWAAGLVDLGLLSFPLLPWCDSRRGRPDETGPAFLVEAPSEDVESPRLSAVGYHQRFQVRADRSWVYVPYFPAEDRCRSEFQKGMRQRAIEEGHEYGGAALVPGLPFVLSGGTGCHALVIAEGQWDAVSFAGSAGWLDSDNAWPVGWWVMGVRGAQGADTMLAWWGRWIGRWRPSVLLLADNDRASLGWDHDMHSGRPWHGEWEPGVTPSFASRLRHAGASGVVVRRVAAQYGKDFNDYVRNRRPTAEAMCRWLGSLGFDTRRTDA